MAFVRSRFIFNHIHRRMLSWKRPDNLQVPYPNVWATFQGRSHADQKPIHYRIQDLSEEYVEDAIQHLLRYFFTNESMCSTIGFIEDETSVKETIELWKSLLKQKMGLICFATDPETGKEKISSVNVSYVTAKNDKELTFEGKCMIQIRRFIKDLAADYDVFERLNTDAYLAGFGMGVGPQFSGDSVGYQMLKARTPLCLAVGVPVSVAPFSGAAVQHIGEKSGFHKVAELKYKDHKQNGRVVFPRLDGSCALMFKEFRNTN